MSESRKIHQSDGEQPKDSDHVALDGDKEFRTSRLSLSKDKASPDGAHEKLLQKDDEAKIVRDMRVDMVDAKFVSGDHRNGDPKIELDANKKQFSGLTKEELMKYADDPFWVNLRWFMFVLFWALWLGMLAGAITIIVRAPKCAPPKPKTWFEKGPLVELDCQGFPDAENCLSAELPLLSTSKVQGVFLQVPTYDVLEDPNVFVQFKALLEKAKEHSIKVIVDLTPNFVSSNHSWFRQSENRTAPFTDYFVWADGKDFDAAGNPKPPNNWVSTLNTSAWTWSEARKAFYLHQFAANQPDLDFNNQLVVKLFSGALKKWMEAGAGGVRLNKARLMLVNSALTDELQATGKGSIPGLGHSEYAYYKHSQTVDQPALDLILTEYAANVAAATPTEDTVFTLKEDSIPELYLLNRPNATKLRPASSAPIAVANATAAAALLNDRIKDNWPMVQLKTDENAERELAFFALLLPAAPVFDVSQLTNDTSSDALSHLTALRSDASVEHGEAAVASVSGRRDGGAGNLTLPLQLLACARWKAGHTGYVAVFNPASESLRANLTTFSSVPESLTVHHVSALVREQTNYTNNYSEQADNILVPGKSTVVLSYVPKTTADN